MRKLPKFKNKKCLLSQRIQIMPVPGKKLDIEFLVTSTNGGRKIMQPIRMSGPSTRTRKWNQFS